MTLTTRAAVLRAADMPYAIEEVTLADLKPREVLVEVVSAGVCHTDARVHHGLGDRAPMVTGHEGAGVVLEVGAAIEHVTVGDHVVLSFTSCGRCRMCVLGHPAYCTHFSPMNVTGRYLDGTTSATGADGRAVGNRFFGQSSFAAHAIADERSVVVVDRDLPLELLGPLGCGLQTGAGCVLNELQVQPGRSIAVFGAGGVGLAAVMAAKVAGASEIIAVDVHESRLATARELGATRTVVGTADDVAAEIVDAGSGVDYIVETSGAERALLTAMSVLATGGRAVMVTADPEVRIAPTSLVGRTAGYSFEGDALPQLFIPKLLRFWREGRFPFEKLVRRYPLDRINDAEADAGSGAAIKPVLVP